MEVFLVALYITSVERGSGKTAVSAGLGKHLLDDGQKIGFFKPVIAGDNSPPIEGADSDATFMKHLFSLEEPVDLLCPVLSDGGNRTGKIKEAYAKVSQGKDVVIIEGISGQRQASHEIVATLGARVIIVEAYSKELLRVINSCKDFKEDLLGLVLNKVPRSRIEQLRGETSTQFSQAGVNILGVLPEDRVLFTLTIGELAEYIQGEILSGAEKSAELVEHLMLGAKCIDPGPLYFGVKANKAVLVESTRSDMQMAALETSTRCLVLTGDTPPKDIVLQRAEEKNVPIITTRDDITAIVTTIETALAKTRFHQENKLARLTEIMERHFDFPAVSKGLGLAG